MRSSAVFVAVSATDVKAAAQELQKQLDLQLMDWRAKHPIASVLSAETRLTSNQYLVTAVHTIVYEENFPSL